MCLYYIWQLHLQIIPYWKKVNFKKNLHQKETGKCKPKLYTVAKKNNRTFKSIDSIFFYYYFYYYMFDYKKRYKL